MQGLIPIISSYVRKNSSKILTVSGCIGVVITTAFAIRDTTKAIKKVQKIENDTGSELSTKEKVKASLPEYIPTIVSGVSTIGCVISASVISSKKYASLSNAYSLLALSYEEYRSKVDHVFGPGSDERVKQSIVINSKDNIYLSSGDNVLFYDDYSRRFFESTLNKVENAQYLFNAKYHERGRITLNEFYEFLDLPPVDYGDVIGWSFAAGAYQYGYGAIEFNNIEVNPEDIYDEDYRDCYIISMKDLPTADYLDY